MMTKNVSKSLYKRALINAQTFSVKMSNSESVRSASSSPMVVDENSRSPLPMKRVVIFLNGTQIDGKLFLVTNSLEELLATSSTKFGIQLKRLFTKNGGEIDDTKLLRDDDILYVSDGEAFVKPDLIVIKDAIRDTTRGLEIASEAINGSINAIKLLANYFS